jgi:HPt (histidine-containing phosphotransfer) domain-containing protein
MMRADARRCQSLAEWLMVSGWLRCGGTQLGSFDRVSTEATGVPAIDMTAIMQLADNDDTGGQFVAEIIKVFLDDLSDRVLTIGLQMKQGDRAGVAATAHAIKGSCGHFGAMHLLELSRELEDRARREPADDIEVAIFTMVAETERVRTALEAFRSTNAQPG